MRLKTMTLLSAVVVMPTMGIAYMQHVQPWPQLAALDFSAIERMGHSAPTVTTDDNNPRSEQPQLAYANGIVEGRQRNVSLRFELTGRLASVDVAEGDQVQQGQVLAQLDSTVWQHQLSEAEAALVSAQAEKRRIQAGATAQDRARARAEVAAAEALRTLTKSRFERAAKLAKSRAVAKQELEDALGKHRVAVAEREAARARLADLEAPPRPHEIQAADAEIALHTARVERARSMLSKTKLLAPNDGVIVRVDAESGELTGPETRIPLVTMVDRSEIRIRAYVEELDALRIQCDQQAHATADGIPGRQFHGTVISCHPAMLLKTEFNHRPDERIDVRTREVVICLDSKEAAELVIGLPMDVFIALVPPGDVDGKVPSQSLSTSLAAIQSEK